MSMLEIAELKEIERKIGGKPFKFAKMTVRENGAAIEEKLIVEKRDKIEKNLKAAGVSGTDAYGELAAFDDNPMAVALFFRWFNSAVGQRQIIQNAAEKAAKGTGEAVLDAMPADDQVMIQLAADICGVTLAPVNAPPKKEDETPEDSSPNPTGNPPSFGK